MCRDLAHGGRQCPSHSDPTWIAQRNATRRRRYARRNGKVLATETVVDEVVPTAELHNPHPSLDQKRIIPTPLDDTWKTFAADADAYSEKITDDELRNELIDYTSVSFEPIRDYLHDKHMISGKPLEMDDDTRAEMAARCDRLDRVIAEADAPENPRTLFRGIYVPDTQGDISEWIEHNYPVGGVVEQKAYMSSSQNPYFAMHFGLASGMEPRKEREIIFEFLTKQGAPLGENTSYMGRREQEVLLPRNAKFQVVAVHRDVDYTIGNNEGDAFKTTRSKTIIQLVDTSE